MLAAFAATGLAAAAVLAPTSRSWRGAAEHSRAFWLVWIVGFAALGFVGPATAGLGWASTAWLVWWTAVAALQPSMVVDVLEVHRFGKRQALVQSAGSPGVAMPAIRWQAEGPGAARNTPLVNGR
jgi:hypothetical protein